LTTWQHAAQILVKTWKKTGRAADVWPMMTRCWRRACRLLASLAGRCHSALLKGYFNSSCAAASAGGAMAGGGTPASRYGLLRI